MAVVSRLGNVLWYVLMMTIDVLTTAFKIRNSFSDTSVSDLLTDGNTIHIIYSLNDKILLLINY